jgi:hypothetical protein
VLREIISQICVTPLCVIAILPKKLSCVSVVLKNSCCFCIANTLPSLRACTQAWQSTLLSYRSKEHPTVMAPPAKHLCFSVVIARRRRAIHSYVRQKAKATPPLCHSEPQAKNLCFITPIPSLRVCDCYVAIHSCVMLRRSRKHLCLFVFSLA